MPETPAGGSPTTPNAGKPAGAPAAAPSNIPEDSVSLGRVEVTDDAPLGGEQPGQPTETPDTLPGDVHPAVREERTRAQRYRQDAEQAFVYDAQGTIIGIREDFAQQIVERMGGARPSDAARAPVDDGAAYKAAIAQKAEQLGFLPEQVEGVLDLVEAVVQRRIQDANAPLLASSAEAIKRGLIESGEVPPKAAPFVAKWMDNAMKLDPRSTMTPEGRETVLRQALGEYVLQEIRSRRGGGRPAPVRDGVRPAAPVMLKPAGSPTGGATPSADEMLVRRKLKLSPGYTQYTPRGE